MLLKYFFIPPSKLSQPGRGDGGKSYMDAAPDTRALVCFKSVSDEISPPKQKIICSHVSNIELFSAQSSVIPDPSLLYIVMFTIFSFAGKSSQFDIIFPSISCGDSWYF